MTGNENQEWGDITVREKLGGEESAAQASMTTHICSMQPG